MRIARELFSELAQLVGMTTRLSNDTRRAEDPYGPILAADSGVDRAYVSRTSALSLTRRLMSSSGWRLRQRSRLPSCLLFPSPMSSVPSHFPEAEEHKASGANLIPTEPVAQDTRFSSFVPAAPVFAPLILLPRVVHRRRA